MTHDEMIAVIKAHKEGKTIQSRFRFVNSGEEGWCNTDAAGPSWDFTRYEYRVKPSSKYRPFENVSEVMEAINEHGDWMKDKNRDFWRKICIIDGIGEKIYVYTCDVPHGETLERCFDVYTFLDGTPFGVLEE